MSNWADLRVALLVLREHEPTSLRHTPSLSNEAIQEPPYKIGLAAWAVDIASELVARFGDDLDLTVGFLSFPDPTRSHHRHQVRNPPPADRDLLASSDEIECWLPDAVEIVTGHDLRTELHVRNRNETELVVRTNGNLTARVVDPDSGAVVGGFAGLQIAPLVRFRLPPGESRSIPLLIGTASKTPSLGYAVPLGQWAIEVNIMLEDGRVFHMPSLPITII